MSTIILIGNSYYTHIYKIILHIKHLEQGIHVYLHYFIEYQSGLVDSTNSVCNH